MCEEFTFLRTASRCLHPPWAVSQIRILPFASASTENVVIQMDGGCHMMLSSWRTGGGTTNDYLRCACGWNLWSHMHAQTLTANAHATATKIMTCDVKAAVCSLKNPTFPSCSWSLETTVQLKKNGYHTLGRLKCYVMAWIRYGLSIKGFLQRRLWKYLGTN